MERRVSRLENDRNSSYDLSTEITSTQREHSRRFDAVEARFDAVEARFDAVDARLDGVDARLDALDRRFDSVELTLAEVVRRLPEPS